MNGRPFSSAEFEAAFGAEGVARRKRNVAEAPSWSPEQLLAGRRIFASFCVPQPAAESPAADAA